MINILINVLKCIIVISLADNTLLNNIMLKKNNYNEIMYT